MAARASAQPGALAVILSPVPEWPRCTVSGLWCAHPTEGGAYKPENDSADAQ